MKDDSARCGLIPLAADSSRSLQIHFSGGGKTPHIGNIVPQIAARKSKLEIRRRKDRNLLDLKRRNDY